MTPHLSIRKNPTMDAIKSMAAALSHDFNRILTTISYSIELALDDIPKNSLAYEDLARVLKTSLEAGQYIHDIMSFCKPPKSGFTSFDVINFSYETANRLRQRAPEHIVFQTIMPDSTATAKADPSQLNEIMEHLVDNAIQSIGALEGHIDFSVGYSHRPMDDGHEEPCLYLGISDNGPGISEADMAKVIDPFFTTKQKTIHKGLGLSKVFSLVENHQGLLEITSIPREKTVFGIHLPVLI